MTTRALVTAGGILLLAVTPAAAQQLYPNITGEVLMEDERVVVQHFVLEPGKWEGIHEHPEYQLVIVLQRSEEVTMKFGDEVRVVEVSEEDRERMRVFWRPGPVALSDEHESGNTGTRPLEWIAISFKSDSIATEDSPSW